MHARTQQLSAQQLTSLHAGSHPRLQHASSLTWQTTRARGHACSFPGPTRARHLDPTLLPHSRPADRPSAQRSVATEQTACLPSTQRPAGQQLLPRHSMLCPASSCHVPDLATCPWHATAFPLAWLPPSTDVPTVSCMIVTLPALALPSHRASHATQTSP